MHVFVIILEVLFFAGMAGSIIVVILTLIEDVGVFKKDRDELEGTASPERL